MGLNLEAKLGLNSQAFERGLERSHEKVGEFLKEFIIGAVGVGTLEMAFEKTTATAKELVNEAKRLSMTVEQVQVLKHAAQDAGQEFDAVAASLEKIDLARAKALGGDKKVMISFQTMGITKEDLLKKTAADLFTGKISDKVKTTNPEEIAAPLRDVLGKGAGEAVAILKTDFNELGQKLQSMGAIMSTETAAHLNALSDEFELVSKIIVSQLAPALLAFAEWAYKIILKGAGKVAGFAAGIGSEVGQVGVFKTVENAIGQTVTGAARMMGIKDAPTPDQVRERVGISTKEVEARKADAEEPWKKSLEEFELSLKKAADQLKAPKPDFSKTEVTAKQVAEPKEHKQRPPREGDALIKTGNFLGASRGVITNAQTALAQHTAATAQNTKQAADNTRRVADGIDTLNKVVASSSTGHAASAPQTIWAAN